MADSRPLYDWADFGSTTGCFLADWADVRGGRAEGEDQLDGAPWRPIGARKHSADDVDGCAGWHVAELDQIAVVETDAPV